MHTLLRSQKNFAYKLELRPGTQECRLTFKKKIFSGSLKWVCLDIKRPKDFPFHIPFEPTSNGAKGVPYLIIDSTWIFLLPGKEPIFVQSPQPLPEHLNSKTFYFFCSYDGTFHINFRDRLNDKNYNLIKIKNTVYKFDDKNITPYSWSYGNYHQYDKKTGTFSFFNEKQKKIKSIAISQMKQVRTQPTKSPKLHDFSDLISFMKKWYAWRKSKSPTFSYAKWAQEMGLAGNTTLLKVFNGSRSIGSSLELSLKKSFSFNKKESLYFHFLIDKQNISKDKSLSKFYEQLALTYLGEQPKEISKTWFQYKIKDQWALVYCLDRSSFQIEVYFVKPHLGNFTYIYRGHPYLLTISNPRDSNFFSENNVVLNQNFSCAVSIVGAQLIFVNKKNQILTYDLRSVFMTIDDGHWKWNILANENILIGKSLKIQRVIVIFLLQDSIRKVVLKAKLKSVDDFIEVRIVKKHLLKVRSRFFESEILIEKMKKINPKHSVSESEINL